LLVLLQNGMRNLNTSQIEQQKVDLAVDLSNCVVSTVSDFNRLKLASKGEVVRDNWLIDTLNLAFIFNGQYSQDF
jgi:hypothetical protein